MHFIVGVARQAGDEDPLDDSIQNPHSNIFIDCAAL